MKIEIEYRNLEGELDYLEVDIHGEFATETAMSPSGKEVTFPICENITWDTDDFTEHQNKEIATYIDKNYDSLDAQLCKELDSED